MELTYTEVVCYFVVKDKQPLNTVNDVVFRKMIHEFKPHYTTPDRKKVATHYLPQMFDRRSSALGKLWGLLSITLTDLWTSRAKHDYTGLTFHYITQDFSLHSHLLETKEFVDTHRASIIAEELETILDKWNLPLDKLSAATTDNGANTVLAAEILGWQQMPCFSHTLHRVVEKARCRHFGVSFQSFIKSPPTC